MGGIGLLSMIYILLNDDDHFQDSDHFLHNSVYFTPHCTVRHFLCCSQSNSIRRLECWIQASIKACHNYVGGICVNADYSGIGVFHWHHYTIWAGMNQLYRVMPFDRKIKF